MTTPNLTIRPLRNPIKIKPTTENTQPPSVLFNAAANQPDSKPDPIETTNSAYFTAATQTKSNDDDVSKVSYWQNKLKETFGSNTAQEICEIHIKRQSPANPDKLAKLFNSASTLQEIFEATSKILNTAFKKTYFHYLVEVEKYSVKDALNYIEEELIYTFAVNENFSNNQFWQNKLEKTLENNDDTYKAILDYATKELPDKPLNLEVIKQVFQKILGGLTTSIKMAYCHYLIEIEHYTIVNATDYIKKEFAGKIEVKKTISNNEFWRNQLQEKFGFKTTRHCATVFKILSEHLPTADEQNLFKSLRQNTQYSFNEAIRIAQEFAIPAKNKELQCLLSMKNCTYTDAIEYLKNPYQELPYIKESILHDDSVKFEKPAELEDTNDITEVNSLLIFPTEILVNIFYRLAVNDALHLRITSKYINQFLADCHTYWEKELKEKFGSVLLSNEYINRFVKLSRELKTPSELNVFRSLMLNGHYTSEEAITLAKEFANDKEKRRDLLFLVTKSTPQYNYTQSIKFLKQLYAKFPQAHGWLSKGSIKLNMTEDQIKSSIGVWKTNRYSSILHINLSNTPSIDVLYGLKNEIVDW